MTEPNSESKPNEPSDNIGRECRYKGRDGIVRGTRTNKKDKLCYVVDFGDFVVEDAPVESVEVV